MKDLVEKLYNMAGNDWDGDFLALDDAAKDFATKEYLTGEGSELLGEIFPECCFGAEKLLLDLLYSSPQQCISTAFSQVMSAILKTQRVAAGQLLVSEAILPHDRAALSSHLYAGRLNCFASVFAHLVYRYIEDILRDGCGAWFDEIHAEYCEDQYSYSEE